MITNKIPFPATTLTEITRKIIHNSPQPYPEDRKVQPDIDRLIHMMLQKNPNHRPTITQLIKNEPYINKIMQRLL
jgi:serine/threonine protein kinase